MAVKIKLIFINPKYLHQWHLRHLHIHTEVYLETPCSFLMIVQLATVPT